MTRKQFNRSIQYHERALYICKEINSRSDGAKCHIQLGRARTAVFQYDEATEHYQKVLKVPEITGVERELLESEVYNHLGGVYQAHGNYHKAQTSYQKALEISNATGNEIGEAVVCNNLGVLNHECLGKLDEALVYHQKALVIFKAFRH